LGFDGCGKVQIFFVAHIENDSFRNQSQLIREDCNGCTDQIGALFSNQGSYRKARVGVMDKFASIPFSSGSTWMQFNKQA
jgi:hypothetical protein